MVHGGKDDVLHAAFDGKAADKVRRLLEFDQDGEVADPYGGSVEAYRECFRGMQKALENIVVFMQKQNF